jgi:hypothetical protein
MNWHLPATVADMAAATRSVSSWRAQRFNLAADAVFVLSVSGMGLDRSHPLSDHVMTGAERYKDDYMSGKGRKAHPSVTVYYVRDLATSRAVLALQADGTILDELDTVRPDLRPATREALRDAFRIAADNAVLQARQD